MSHTAGTSVGKVSATDPPPRTDTIMTSLSSNTDEFNKLVGRMETTVSRLMGGLPGENPIEAFGEEEGFIPRLGQLIEYQRPIIERFSQLMSKLEEL